VDPNSPRVYKTFIDLNGLFQSVEVKFEVVFASAFGDTPLGKQVGVKTRSNTGIQLSAPRGGGLYYDDKNCCDF